MSSPRSRPDSPGSGPARPAQTGATATTPPAHRRKPWWLWALLALAALAILLISLAQCGGGDTPQAAAPSAAPSAAPPAAGSAGSGAAGAAGAGTLTADGASLLPVAAASSPSGDLTAQAGKAVTAQGVLVQSVPADEGFWVGDSATDRVWVQLNGSGESGYAVKQGDRVDFTGTMTAQDPAFAGQIGVDAAEGADQLTTQAEHIQVDKSVLKLSAA